MCIRDSTAHDVDRPVLLVGRAAPAHWPVRLRDLDSRLRAITAVEVEAPDDELLRRLPAVLIMEIGLEILGA